MKMPSLLFVFLILPGFSLVSQTMLDRIVAVVDREIITESELNERLTFIAAQNRLDPATPGMKRQVLDAMVTEKLVLARAILDSIVVSDAEVTQALDQQLENFIRQAGSQERVEQMYGMPISRIKREYREEMKKQLLVQRVRQMQESSIRVSRREVEEFYEAYRDSLPPVPEEVEINHLFVVPKPDTVIEQQTRGLMLAIRDSIRAGGNFEDFARRHSHDLTGARGGDLGWARRGDYVKEFEEALFALQERQISDIVKTQFGFHIIQLLERRGESVHARHILLRVEKGEASDSAAVEYLRSLRARALAGESFADLARQFSEDEDTKPLGGNIGRVSLDQLAPEFAEVVKTLKEGEISDPHRIDVGTNYGFQIVLLRKRIPSHAMNIEDDYRRVEQIALYFKRNRLNTEWVEELKGKIHWEVRL